MAGRAVDAGIVAREAAAVANALLAEAEEAASTGHNTQAREAYERALAIYETAGDLSGQGYALLGMATLARDDGQEEVAREIYGRSAAVFEKAADAMGSARVTFALGELARARFDNEAALAAFQDAITIFHSLGEWRMEGQALLGVADSGRRMGRILAARAAAARASAIFEILGDRPGEDAAERSWTELMAFRSELDQLKSQADSELVRAGRGASPILEAQKYLALGRLERLSGRFAIAREAFRLAGSTFARIRMPGGEMDAWADLGDLERGLGNADEALEAYTAALAAYEEAQSTVQPEEAASRANGHLVERVAFILIGLGEAESRLGHDGGRRFKEARALLPEGSSSRVDGALLLGKGRLYRAANEFEQARAAFDAAESTFVRSDVALGMGEAMLAKADLLREQGEAETALDLYVRALNAFLAARDRIGEVDARWGWAEALSTTGESTMEARIQYRLAARIFAEVGFDARAATALERARTLE